jgi:hypothetical protein
LATLGSWYVSLAWPGLRGPPVDLLLVFGFPLVLLAAVAYSFFARNQPWRRRVLPLACLLAAVLLWLPILHLGRWTRVALFRRNLPIYEAAVSPIGAGPGPRSVILSLDSLPRHAGLCCGRAFVRIEADGSFRASFVVQRNLRMVYSPIALDTGAVNAPFRFRRVPFARNWYEEWN